MTETRTPNVKNPLVLIAVFAGVSEVAMAFTLIKLPEAIQGIFVWFVMGFPLVLVLGFFFVLYRKPAVLFSPSDYKKEEMYLESIANTNGANMLGRRIDQLEESIHVIQTFVAELENGTRSEGKFTKTWRQLEALHEMEKNNLYTFLRQELGLSSQEIAEIVLQTEIADDLSMIVEHVTGDSWKSERVRSVFNQFPKAYSDFEELQNVISRKGD